MFPFLRLGPLLIQMPGLALLAGLWGAMTLVEKEAKLLKLNAAATINMVLYGLLVGLIGARLVYAAQHLNSYLANPLGLLSLNTSALDPAAGLIVAVIIMVLFGRRKHLPLRPTLDALAPGLALLMVALGVANILSGNAYGSPSNLPWAIYLWDEYRHPTQFYETLAALIILVIWKVTSTELRGSGIGFLMVVALSAAARIFLEAFHGDSLIWSGGFRGAQVVSLIILAVAIYFIKQWGEAGSAATQPEQITG